jgi:hypothetical protein
MQEIPNREIAIPSMISSVAISSDLLHMTLARHSLSTTAVDTSFHHSLSDSNNHPIIYSTILYWSMLSFRFVSCQVIVFLMMGHKYVFFGNDQVIGHKLFQYLTHSVF